MPGAGEHLVQRPGGADRLYPGRRLPLLHADQHRLSRALAVPASKDGAAGVAGGGRLAQGSPTRLTPGEGRKFAFTLAGAFGILAAISWWRGHVRTSLVLAVVAALFALAGLLVP